MNSLFDPRCFVYISTLGPTVEFSAFDIFLRSPQFNVQFLKSLTCTYFVSLKYFGLNDINKLLLLERLEMNFSDNHRPFKPGHGKLSLPNLKTLHLDSYDHYDFTMEVDVPRCEGVHLRNGYSNIYENLRVHFLSPASSVKFLSLHVYDPYHKSCNVFKNVEFLQVVKGAGLIEGHFFAAYPRLRTLKILRHDSLEELKQLFQLSKQRHVKMVFHGIQLLDGSELDTFEESDFVQKEFFHGEYYPLDRLIDNHNKLEEGLNFIERIEISERAYKLLEADADRFLKIFNNLIHISSKIRIGRPELLLRLLKSSSSLRDLCIENSDMPQQWFDQLADIKTLNTLRIVEETKIDLSFTFKLPILDALRTNRDVDLRNEIRFDERSFGGFSLLVEKGKFLLHITKIFLGFQGKEMRYTYKICKSEKDFYERYLLSTSIMHNGYAESFEDLVRRYEVIKNEV